MGYCLLLKRLSGVSEFCHVCSAGQTEDAASSVDSLKWHSEAFNATHLCTHAEGTGPSPITFSQTKTTECESGYCTKILEFLSFFFFCETCKTCEFDIEKMRC